MNENPPLRVAIWAAVSSKQQATDEKDSIPRQVLDGKTWTAAAGAEVVAIYEIPGHTRDYIHFYDAERDIPE